MLENIIGRLPATLIIICAVLSFLIPFLFKISNGMILKKVNPAWKKDES